MTKTVIRVQGLCKAFKDKTILKNITFEVKQGDCVALIGPNGSGKTTLFNCLLGDYVPSAGQVQVLDLPPQAHQLKESVGILFQDNTTESKMTVSELIAFQRAIYNNPLSEAEIDRLLGFTEQQKKQFADSLSGGQRRLLSVVLTLIGQPELIFMDEPTAGMDTSTRKRFWEIVNQLKSAGKTIIYSSHYIEEVEHTADRILVLHQGELLRDTTPYLMRTEEKEKVFSVPASYLNVVQQAPIKQLVVKSDVLQFTTTQPAVVLERLVAGKCPIEDIEMTNRTLLDSIFENAKGDRHEDI